MGVHGDAAHPPRGRVVEQLHPNDEQAGVHDGVKDRVVDALVNAPAEGDTDGATLSQLTMKKKAMLVDWKVVRCICCGMR